MLACHHIRDFALAVTSQTSFGSGCAFQSCFQQGTQTCEWISTQRGHTNKALHHFWLQAQAQHVFKCHMCQMRHSQKVSKRQDSSLHQSWTDAHVPKCQVATHAGSHIRVGTHIGCGSILLRGTYSESHYRRWTAYMCRTPAWRCGSSLLRRCTKCYKTCRSIVRGCKAANMSASYIGCQHLGQLCLLELVTM